MLHNEMMHSNNHTWSGNLVTSLSKDSKPVSSSAQEVMHGSWCTSMLPAPEHYCPSHFCHVHVNVTHTGLLHWM